MVCTGIFTSTAKQWVAAAGDWLDRSLDPDDAALGVVVDAIVCAQLRALRCPPPLAIGSHLLARPSGIAREAFASLHSASGRRRRAAQRGPPRHQYQ